MGAIGTKLYRRRYIPNENVLLKDDVILLQDESTIVTKWNVLKPRKDFTHGYSCYLLDYGFKISLYIDANERVLYHYCDIIQTEYDADADVYTFHDLLVDVIVMPNGFVRVMDVGEVSEALEAGLITVDTAKRALTLLERLLGIIYSGQLGMLTARMDEAIHNASGQSAMPAV